MPTAYAPITRNFTSASSNDESRARKSSFKGALIHGDERAGLFVEHAAVRARQLVELAAQVPGELRPFVVGTRSQ
jgi:hypothetical protein